MLGQVIGRSLTTSKQPVIATTRKASTAHFAICFITTNNRDEPAARLRLWRSGGPLETGTANSRPESRDTCRKVRYLAGSSPTHADKAPSLDRCALRMLR